jgi:hypothetical protein
MVKDVDLTSISAESVGSIIIGQQKRAGVPKPELVGRFGDNPDLDPLACVVGAQESAAVDEGVVVSVAVTFIEVTPIAGDVAGQELTCLLTRIPKGFKSSRRGDNPPEAELLGLVKTHFVS